jgi:hypothetical protein
MTKLILGAVVALALLIGPAAAQASYGYEVVLTRSEARQMVRESTGHVHHCHRRAPRWFRCWATYWEVLHEAEEVEPGVWVEISAVPVSKEYVVDVTLAGLHIHFT